MNHRELRTKISEILVIWHMPTRQAAISDLIALFNQYKEGGENMAKGKSPKKEKKKAKKGKKK